MHLCSYHNYLFWGRIARSMGMHIFKTLNLCQILHGKVLFIYYTSTSRVIILMQK